MQQFTFVIRDPLGIHARPAGLLAKAAGAYADTAVTISKDGSTVRAGQLFRLMTLGVRQGDTVTVAAEGPSEEAAIAALRKFFSENL